MVQALRNGGKPAGMRAAIVSTYPPRACGIGTFAADVRAFGEQSQTYGDPTLTRNREAFGNVIYRPRSDLLLSLEYRRLRTFTIYDSSYEAGQINMSMGVLF